MTKQNQSKKLRTLQEIFDLMIASQNYTENLEFMCHAITRAYESDHLLTEKEKDKALAAIRNYCGVNCFDNTAPLASTLRMNGRDCSYPARLRIYQNWKRRPKLTPFSC